MTSDKNPWRVDLSGMSNEEIGECVRMTMLINGRGRKFSLTGFAPMMLIAKIHDNNAAIGSMNFNGACINGIEVGDWRVCVEKINRRRKLGDHIAACWGWLCSLGAKKATFEDMFDGKTKITSLSITERNDK